MWRGYEGALLCYGNAMVAEWIKRGYNDTCGIKMLELMTKHFEVIDIFKMPPWLGNGSFHRSHQSNLVRKLPEHYKKIFGDIPDDLPYIWPV